MTTGARLNVSDAQGQRAVAMDKPVFTIGRRNSVDLQVTSRDVSKDHARITREGTDYLIADCGSRFGTFVNGEPVVLPRVLVHGDSIRLGHSDRVILTFLTADEPTIDLSSVSSENDLHLMAAIMDGLRALGSGRVLEEVLSRVLDSALEVTRAERGFVMLASASGKLEFRVGRATGRQPLSGASFARSENIPREVFETGHTQVFDDLAGDPRAGVHAQTLHAGIRQVLCVPLRVRPPAAGAEDRVTQRIIGVLYLDGRARGRPVDGATRSSLEAFALQAALAIESARLYAEADERAKAERDLRLTAELHRALLAAPRFSSEAFDLAATSLPCRTVGGDFFDYLELPDGRFGFALGDVAGKGPSAALLAVAAQSHFVANAPLAENPADLMTRLNRALMRRTVEARFATMFYGVLASDGGLLYANAGQEPPALVRKHDVEALEVGGPVIGMLGRAVYAFGTTSLEPGDLVVVCSDGVTEARREDTEEFGRERLRASLAGEHGQDPESVLERLLGAIREFSGAEPQADDITVLVLRYKGQ